MKLKNAVDNLFLGIKFSFYLIWKNEKSMYIYLFIPILIDTINSFLFIIFPKYLLDGLVQHRYTFTIAFICIFAGLQLLLRIIKNIVNFYKENCSERNRIVLKTLLIEKMTELRFEQMEQTKNLEKYEFAKKCIDKGSVESYISSIMSVLSSIIIVTGVIYILRDLPFWAIIIIFSVIVTNAVVNIINAKYSYQEMTEETPTERSLYYFRGRLMNKKYAKEIRSFHLNNFISQKTKKYIEDFFNINKKYNRKHYSILWWTHIVSAIQIFCLYFYNILIYFRKNITIGSFTMNISAIFQFSSSINTIISQLISMIEQSNYLNNYYSFLKLKNNYVGVEKISTANTDIFTIDFVNVSFQYPGQDTYALKNINVHIQSGEKISIVGHNGAGKTTFIKLLLGLYKPTEGVILFNGVNIEKYEPESYMDLFSTVMQDYQIYGFTVYDNITFSSNSNLEKRERATEVIKKIGLENTINCLQHTIDTYITQQYDKDGIELSGGEHQKIAIARALFRDSKIFILDEPTSALSPQSEYEIYKRFGEITKEKTVIYISHRLSSCLLCDKVIVFNEGNIIENGTHNELIKANSMYAEMYKKQASLYGF